MASGITEQPSNITNLISSEMDLFSIPDIHTSYKNRNTIQINPSTSLDSGPIEFSQNIPHEKVVDLYNIRCRFFIKIQTAGGEDIAATNVARPTEIVPNAENAAEVAARNIEISEWDDKIVLPVCNFGHAIFKDFQIHLGAYLMQSPSSGLYPICSYIQTLFTYDKDTKETRLKQQLWVKDSGKNIDTFTDPEGFCQNEILSEHQTRNQMNNFKEKYSNNNYKNPGAFERFDRTAFSKLIPITIKPSHPFLNQGKFLPGGFKLTLKFFRNDPKFALLAKNAETTEYKITFVKAYCLLPYVEPDEALTTALFQQFLKNNTPLRYPMITTNIVYKTVPENMTDLNFYNVTSGGILPKKGLIFNMRTEAFYGSYSHNPFCFPHLDVSQLIIQKNGTAIEHDTYDFDFEKDDYGMGYSSLDELLSTINSNIGLDLSYDEYKHGFTFFGFNLCKSDNESSLHLEPSEIGTLDILMKVSTPLPYSVTTVVYLDYQQILDINPDGTFAFKHISQE